MSPIKQYNVSARPETLQVYSFTNGNETYDQLEMKTPRKLKEDVINKFPYFFLERKQNRDKSMYENKPQIAVAGTKHTIITDTNKILHKKRASKPLNQRFQNPLSRPGEIPRGKDGRFATTEQQEEKINTAEHSQRCSTPVLEESVLNNTLTPRTPELDWENTIISPVYARGRKKLIRDRKNTSTPGSTINSRPTTEDDPNVITVVDQNGNTDLIKSENIEPNENQNEQNIRKSTRL